MFQLPPTSLHCCLCSIVSLLPTHSGTMVVPEPGRKKKRQYTSKTNKSNVRAALLIELQAAIAYACYDSPSLICGVNSMTETQQYKTIADLYFGNSEEFPNSSGFVDQFLHGLNKFHGLYTTSSCEIEPGVSHDMQPQMLLTLIPILVCLYVQRS